MAKSNRGSIALLTAGIFISAFSAPSAFSADWSTNELQYQYGNLKKAYQGGGSASETHGTSVFTFQHSSGWKYGDNFFFADFSKYGKTDQESQNAVPSDNELYAELMLHLACRNGGQMLRKNVGVLEVGALADFISVDLRGPHNQPATRAVCCLTSSARGSDVRHVVVDGQHIVADGRSTRIDEEKVIADTLQATKQVIKKAGITELTTAWKSPKSHYASN